MKVKNSLLIIKRYFVFKCTFFSHLQGFVIKHCYQLNNNKNNMYFSNIYIITGKGRTKYSLSVSRFKKAIALQ